MARIATKVDTTLARTIDRTRRRLAGVTTGSATPGLGQPRTAAWARSTGRLGSLGEAACAPARLGLVGTVVWAPGCTGLVGAAAATSAARNAGTFAGLPQTSQ